MRRFRGRHSQQEALSGSKLGVYDSQASEGWSASNAPAGHYLSDNTM